MGETTTNEPLAIEVSGSIRSCHVIDVPAPAEMAPYAFMRIWVAKKHPMFLKAEAYGEDEDLIRRLYIKSLKKIDDRWMIKDLEVESFPIRHRTKLRIHDVTTGGQSYSVEPDVGGNSN